MMLFANANLSAALRTQAVAVQCLSADSHPALALIMPYPGCVASPLLNSVKYTRPW